MLLMQQGDSVSPVKEPQTVRRAFRASTGSRAQVNPRRAQRRTRRRFWLEFPWRRRRAGGRGASRIEPVPVPQPAYEPEPAARGLHLLMAYYRFRDRLLPFGRLRRLIYELLADVFFPVSWIKYFPTLGRRLAALIAFFFPYPGLRRSPDVRYQAWIDRHEPDASALAVQRRRRFQRAPLISVIVPVYRTPPLFLKEMIQSVRRQTYGRWELCLAVGGKLEAGAERRLRRAAAWDKRLRVRFLRANLGIVGNSNAALGLATGDYIAFLDHDDRLPPFALFEIAAAVERTPGADFIYSDEDKLSTNGQSRSEPHFKPDFSPDTLRSYNYIAHFCAIKKSLLERTGGFRNGFDGSQDYDLILRATERARKIVHIPKILYHWRLHAHSTSFAVASKLYALQAARRALADHLRRCGLQGRVAAGQAESLYRIRYALTAPLKVTIIIPNRDQTDLLRRCVESILEKTEYTPYEIMIVDNRSTDPKTFRLYRQLQREHRNVRVLAWNKRFHYGAVNNFAVKKTDAPLILFCNNDIEVIRPDWLTSMAEFAQRPDVGAVGAKLYYPDRRIQHAGVIVGLGGVAGHSHKHFPMDQPGYFRRLQVIQNLSAVTAACLLLRRSVFTEVNGFDPHYPLAFNDVDLCLKIRARGYLVVWTPYAELYHHESKTRGYEDTPAKIRRFQREFAYFRKKWRRFLKQGDPYYNPNLTLDREDFSLE